MLSWTINPLIHEYSFSFYMSCGSNSQQFINFAIQTMVGTSALFNYWIWNYYLHALYLRSFIYCDQDGNHCEPRACSGDVFVTVNEKIRKPLSSSSNLIFSSVSVTVPVVRYYSKNKELLEPRKVPKKIKKETTPELASLSSVQLRRSGCGPVFIPQPAPYIPFLHPGAIIYDP